MATSSGGTLAGLAIANYLTGEKLRIHGFCASKVSNFFYEHVERTLKEYNIYDVEARNICHVIDGYVGRGNGAVVIEDLGMCSLFFQFAILKLFSYCQCFLPLSKLFK